MTLDRISSQLNLNIYKNSIFYIPIKLIPPEEREYFNNSEIAKYLNNIMLFDEKGNPYDYKDKPYSFSILSKTSLFEKNMFTLVDQKERLSDFQFKFLIDKYYEKVNIFHHFSNWLNNNLEINFPNIEVEIKQSFQIQLENFNKHSENLIQQFNLNINLTSLPNFNENKELGEIFKEFKNSTNSIKFEKPYVSITKKVDPSAAKNTPGENDELPPKRFSDYILHEKNKEIEAIILKNFKGKKGKALRCVLEYLERCKYITLEHGKKIRIYNALRISYNNNICKQQAIWGYEIDKANDKTYRKIREAVAGHLTKLKL